MENIEKQKCKRGAQHGNKNALKHGFYSHENREKRRELNRVIKESWMKTMMNADMSISNFCINSTYNSNNNEE